MSAGSSFILDNYKTEKVLQKTSYSCTELVMYDGIPYVRKIINATGLPYVYLRNIVHTCLPHVFYAAEDEGKTYVIEEYISGRTLKECLELGISFSAEQQEKIALQLCTVLQFLHNKGILHRDIKPSNIIVTHDLQQVKLIDFGIGRSFDSNCTQDAQDTRIMGTPGYAPPEQYGFTNTDQRSDIYALGKTLLELKNKNSDPYFIKVLQRCLEFDPDKRYQNMDEMVKALTVDPKRNFFKQIVLGITLLSIIAMVIGYFVFNRQNEVSVSDAVPKSNAEQTLKQQSQETGKTAEKVTDLSQPENIQDQPVNIQPQPVDTKQQNDNSSRDKQQESIEQNLFMLGKVKLKQVGFEWWFAKDTLKTVDAKENIFTFKGWHNKGPLVTVENIGDYPAVNPTVKLELYSFGMKSDNFEYQTDSSHKEKVEFSGHDRLGISRRVLITLEGTIPPHSRYTFSSLQKVKDFYIYYKGDHGTVLGTMKCTGLIPVAMGYEFKLK